MAHAPESQRARIGPYALGERLGLGGMAEVFVAYRAGPHGFAKKVAVKRILPQLAQDQRFVAMFCDEARICAQLCHPNIVQVVDFGESNGELFMAMEFVDGVSLARLLRWVSSRRERFPLSAALYVAHEVLSGLAFAHEACDELGRPLGIVHRDVSPGNVLIGRAGDVKLADFGIVRSAFVDRRTYPGELKGKVGYMSPEQVMGTEVDQRSDLFTAGIILSEMLLARPMFTGQNEFEILTKINEADLGVLDKYGADLPPGLLTALRRAMAVRPADRFQSAREFSDAVRDVAKAFGLSLSDSEFLPWLSSLGILPSRSGTHEVTALPRQRPAPKRLEATTLPPPTAPTRPARSSPRIGEPLTKLADWRRKLDRFELPGILYGLAFRKETGLLVCRAEHGETRLFLVAGQLAGVVATARRDLLGERLVRSGRLTRAELEGALREAVTTRRTLGDVLLAHGRISRGGLLSELVAQAEDRVLDLVSWTRGQLYFTSGVREIERELDTHLDLPRLVTRGVREGYGEEEIAGWLGPARRLPVTRGLAKRMDPVSLGLTLEERRALERALKSSSIETLVAQLAGEGVAPASVTLRALFLGLSLGMLALPGWPER
jgi:serine/threonine protein kinase